MNGLKKPMSLAGLQASIAALPTYAKDAKVTMHIDKAQELVNHIRSLDPPMNDPEWCDSVQEIIDLHRIQLQENIDARTTRSR